MADVIRYPAIRDDAELEIAVAEYLNEKGWADNANARKKARETQIKDYMGMASEKVLSNGIKIRVGMPIIRNSFDVNSFKLAHPCAVQGLHEDLYAGSTFDRINAESR